MMEIGSRGGSGYDKYNDVSFVGISGIFATQDSLYFRTGPFDRVQ